MCICYEYRGGCRDGEYGKRSTRDLRGEGGSGYVLEEKYKGFRRRDGRARYGRLNGI